MHHLIRILALIACILCCPVLVLVCVLLALFEASLAVTWLLGTLMGYDTDSLTDFITWDMDDCRDFSFAIPRRLVSIANGVRGKK